MMAHVRALNNFHGPYGILKRYEGRLDQFGKNISESFEELWGPSEDDGDEFRFDFQYPAETSYDDETWRRIRSKHYNHLVTTMKKIGCTNIEELPAATERRLVELVMRDVNEDLTRVRLEIQTAEERFATCTEADYAFCQEKLGWSDLKIQKLRGLGEDFDTIWVRVPQEEEDLLCVAAAHFVNGDPEAFIKYTQDLLARRGSSVKFINIDQVQYRDNEASTTNVEQASEKKSTTKSKAQMHFHF
jgi:hypothetical protein